MKPRYLSLRVLDDNGDATDLIICAQAITTIRPIVVDGKDLTRVLYDSQEGSKSVLTHEPVTQLRRRIMAVLGDDAARSIACGQKV